MKTIKLTWISHGPNKIYINLANQLTKKFSDLNLVFITGNDKKKKIEKTDFRIKILDKKWKFSKLVFFPLTIKNWLKGLPGATDIPTLVVLKKLHYTLKNEQPDIVISNIYFKPYSWSAASYCKKNNIPFILQTEIKRMPKRLFQKLATKIFLKIMKIHMPKNSLILSWTKEGVNFANKNLSKNNKVQLLEAGVDTKLFHKVKNSKKNSSKLKLMNASRLVPYKRYDVMLKALKYLKNNKKVDFEFQIFGNGPLKKQLEKTIKKYDLEKNVFFHKRVPYIDMKKYYSQNDALILHSDNEAIGMVVPEAMACGTTVIVSDNCGATTYVKEGVNGLTFKANNHIDLANKIMIFKDKEKLKKMSLNAEKIVEEEFSTEKVTEKFYKVITEQLNK